MLLAPLLLQLTPAVADTPPDVVVFLIDDVGVLDVNVVDTPCIDALAAVGADFRRGYAQPMCAPSRWSLLLSEWRGNNAGLVCDSPGPSAKTLDHGLDSIPKVMEGAGYATAIFGRWGVGTHPLAEPDTDDWKFTPHLWGFESWRAGVPDGTTNCIPFGGYSNWLRVDDGVVGVETSYQTIELRDAFVEWWDATEGPRFAYVALQAAHKGGIFDAWHVPPPAAMPPGWTPPGTGAVLTDRERYEAMVVSADYAIGRMLEAVDLTRTLVVVTADNGTPFEVPPPGATAARVKFSTFEGGVHVPFVVAGLGIRPARIHQPVSTVDLGPTLADVAGVAAPRSFDGQSLVPALFGERLERRWVYVQKGDFGDHALIEERWKLRVNQQGNEKLYDLARDPGERNPLDPRDPAYADIVARLRAEIAAARL